VSPDASLLPRETFRVEEGRGEGGGEDKRRAPRLWDAKRFR
jgi:hypothetical protein